MHGNYEFGGAGTNAKLKPVSSLKKRRWVGHMDADTTVMKKKLERNQMKPQRNKWRQVVRCLLDTYGLSAHGS